MTNKISMLFIFVFMFISCNKSDEIQFEKFISEWLVLGPFPNSEGKTKFEPHDSTCFGYFTDYLVEHGGETEIIPRNGMAHVSPMGDTIRWQPHNSPSHKINFNEIYTPNDEVVAYAATQLLSPREREVVFSVGSDDGIKIWLNGELVYDRLIRRGARMDDDFVPVRLKKGVNRILLKVEDVAGGWGFFFRLKKMEDAKSYVLEHFDVMLPKPYKIVRSRDSLFIPPCDDRLNILGRSFLTDVEVTHLPTGNVVLKKIISVNSREAVFAGSGLNEGYYQLNLNIRNPEEKEFKKREKFYVGNIWKVRDELKKEYNKLLAKGEKNTQKVRINVEGNFQWLDYNIGNIPRMLDIDEGRRAFSAMIDLKSIIKALKNGDTPFKDKNGRLIRGYKSSVDETPKYFQIYVPQCYQPEESIPVVITIAGVRTLINSFFPYVVRQDRYLDVRKSLSEQYGFITVLINGRGNAFHQYVKGLGEDDIFNVINALKTDYNIDEGKIFLIGYSAGGHAALDLAIHFPHFFAGVAAVAPETDYRLSKDSNLLPPVIRLVEDANNTIDFTENLLHVPVYLQHGSEDEFAPIEHSKKMAYRLEEIGGKVKFKEIPFATHSFYNIDPDRSSYEWFSKQKRRDPYPNKVIYKTSMIKYNRAYWVTVEGLNNTIQQAKIEVNVQPENLIEVTTNNIAGYTLELNEEFLNKNAKVMVITNGTVSFSDFIPWKGKITIQLHNTLSLKKKKIEGPIDAGLSSSFIVVQGSTSRNPHIIDAIATEVATFQNKWQNTYFGTCRVKRDIDISDADIRNHNLILFGSSESNLITSKIVGSLPVKSKNKNVVFNDEVLSGDDLGFRFIYPNPLNNSKYVVLNAGLTPGAVTGMTKRFWEAGWCDFMVFDKYTRDISSTLVTGFFDNQWEFSDNMIWFGHPDARSYLLFYDITWKDTL